MLKLRKSCRVRYSQFRNSVWSILQPGLPVRFSHKTLENKEMSKNEESGLYIVIGFRAKDIFIIRRISPWNEFNEDRNPRRIAHVSVCSCCTWEIQDTDGISLELWPPARTRIEAVWILINSCFVHATRLTLQGKCFFFHARASDLDIQIFKLLSNKALLDLWSEYSDEVSTISNKRAVPVMMW